MMKRSLMSLTFTNTGSIGVTPFAFSSIIWTNLLLSLRLILMGVFFGFLTLSMSVGLPLRL